MRTRNIKRGNLDVTVVGYGGGPIGNIFRPIPAAEAQAQIEAAWNAGIRSFDTAPMYGHGLSEHRLGHALLEHQRRDYVLSTKVGRTLTPAALGTFDTGVWVDTPPFRVDFDYTYDAVQRQVQDSLQRMCQERFDILLVHDIDRSTHGDAQPERFQEALKGAFPALIKLREEGLVKAIGVGVNQASVCVDVLEKVDIDVVLLAGRYTLLEQEPVNDLLPLCEGRDVSVLLGGVFNSGILATGPIDGAKFNYGPASAQIRDRTSRLAEVCLRYDINLPAAAIQFVLAHPVVKQIVLGARTVDQQDKNLHWMNEIIPAEFWRECRDLGLIEQNAPTPI